jgi:transposase
MEKHLQYIGIDVDDKAYHVSVYTPLEESDFEFKCAPSPEILIRALKRHNIDSSNTKICYEASYIGFSIFRRLKKAGYQCEITAPSLIPKQPGMRQKTDKIDARKLARFYAKGLLTFIYIPDETDEAVRDLLRSKRFLIGQQTSIRNHINGLCRRYGLDYKQETEKKSRWTMHHLKWLSSKINQLTQDSSKLIFKILLKQYEDVTKNIELYDSEIEHISELPRFKNKVEILSAFKGVKATTALTLITELGDIRRFDHPRRITSYAGFDLAEYSSGGKERRFGISKFGNPNIRRAAVDAVKFAIRSPTAGKDLTKRRKDVSVEFSSIASKCSSRLFKKGKRMHHAGKPQKKIQVACAREFLGFVWEALSKAA